MLVADDVGSCRRAYCARFRRQSKGGTSVIGAINSWKSSTTVELRRRRHDPSEAPVDRSRRCFARAGFAARRQSMPRCDTSRGPSEGGIRNVQSEFGQLITDARAAPRWVHVPHLLDQGDQFLICWRPTVAMARSPVPVEPESGAMPTHHRLGLDNHQGLCPTGPDGSQRDPQQTIGSVEVGLLVPPKPSRDAA